jgi:peroxin-19
MAADDELDDILSSALEEFREDALSPSARNETVAQTIRKAAQAAENEKKASAKEQHAQETAEGLASVLKGLDSPEFSANLEESLRFLSGGGGGGAGGDPQNPFNGAQVGPEIGELDADLARNLQAMSGVAGEHMPGLGLEAASMEQAGGDMMQNMMKEFEKLAEKKDFDSVMNSMMKQLLSKEIMYEPMKEITEKYPEWLADNERKLSKEEYKKYGMQYQYMQKIVAVFETEPDNFERITMLLMEMQVRCVNACVQCNAEMGQCNADNTRTCASPASNVVHLYTPQVVWSVHLCVCAGVRPAAVGHHQGASARSAVLAGRHAAHAQHGVRLPSHADAWYGGPGPRQDVLRHVISDARLTWAWAP